MLNMWLMKYTYTRTQPFKSTVLVYTNTCAPQKYSTQRYQFYIRPEQNQGNWQERWRHQCTMRAFSVLFSSFHISPYARIVPSLFNLALLFYLAHLIDLRFVRSLEGSINVSKQAATERIISRKKRRNEQKNYIALSQLHSFKGKWNHKYQYDFCIHCAHTVHCTRYTVLCSASVYNIYCACTYSYERKQTCTEKCYWSMGCD